jgi:hypothetical protein
VTCRVRDPQAFDREIEGFNRNEVFVAGRCIEIAAETDGLVEIAVELVDRLPIVDAKTAIEEARTMATPLGGVGVRRGWQSGAEVRGFGLMRPGQRSLQLPACI